MFETLKNAFKDKEVRKKIFITIGFILLYRLGCFIPVPGIDSAVFSTTFAGQGFLGIMNAMTGGSLSQGTLFAMGIGPYINASIIIQLLTVAIPPLERMSKQGEEGKKKLAQITRFATLILAVVQGTAIVLATNGAGSIDNAILGEGLNWLTCIMVIAIFTAGSALTMWIGERINDYGVGNGISILIFVGILATVASALIENFGQIFVGNLTTLAPTIGYLIALVVIFTCIVFVELAERKIPVQYAKQIKGRKMYGGQSTYIPIKVNGSGVMPLIFAFAIISLPDLVLGLFWPGSSAQNWYNQYLGTGSWVYQIFLALFIVFFAYFYAMIQFNPDEISKNIQQYGGFIPGIRPGQPTADYLSKISKRITLFGAIFLALVAIVPSYAFTAINNGVPNALTTAFSATGLLICVSVALDFNNQLESQLMMKHYKGFLK